MSPSAVEDAGYDRVAHKIRGFATEVGLMAEHEGDEKVDIAALVESLVVSLRGEVKPRPHPILYVNLALVLSVAFACGQLYQRMVILEARAQALDTLAVVSAKLDNVTQEVQRIRDRLDEQSVSKRR